jgi:hypothetical protein
MTTREQLHALYREHGELTPSLLVETARPKTNALHNQFEWDDKIAGAAHRLAQAREMIRRFEVVYKPGSDDTESVRGREWINVRPDDGPGVYKHVNDVAEDEFTRTLDLRRMEREWQGMKRRYGHRKEFYALVASDIEEAS